MPTAETIIRATSEARPKQDILRTSPNSDAPTLAHEGEDIFQQQGTASTTVNLIEQSKTEQSDQVIGEARTSIYGRIGEKATLLARASGEDWRESEKKSLLIASWLGYGAVKVAGRFHLPTIAVSYASMDVLAATANTPLTSLTAMAACTVWSRLATGTMNHVIDHNPRVFLTAGEQLPISRHWADALPGLRSYTARDDSEVERQHNSRTARALMHVKRGAVATTRLTPYMSAAGREGQTQAERHKLSWALSLDAGMIGAAMFAGIAQAITTVSEHSPNIAESMQAGIKNPLLWSVMGSIMMVGEFTKNKLTKRRRATRSAAQNERRQLCVEDEISPLASNINYSDVPVEFIRKTELKTLLS